MSACTADCQKGMEKRNSASCCPQLTLSALLLLSLCWRAGDQPRLLTTMQPVRKGTHGGVTLLGLTGAAAGGLLVGAVFYCAAVLSPTLWVFDAQVRLPGTCGVLCATHSHACLPVCLSGPPPAALPSLMYMSL
jgi:hypothetical protein